MTTEPTETGLARRQVLLSTGVVVAAAAVTSACGRSSATGTPSTAASSPSSAPPSSSAASVGPTAASSAAPNGPHIAVSDVPVGGGVVLQDAPVVVTQPTAGTFKAFSAICTHAGCTVAGVQGGVIVCPCHGSTFSITDGSVQGGPAPSALPSVNVTIAGSEVVVSS